MNGRDHSPRVKSAVKDQSFTPDGLNVCIFGLGLEDALNGANIRGGSELQAALLGRALADRGMRVTVIDPIATKTRKIEDGLSVRGIPTWTRGLRGIRFITNRVPALRNAIKETQADIVYTRGFSAYYLFALKSAHRMGARFVLAIASDSDLIGIRSRLSKSYKNRPSVWQLISTIIPNELAFRTLLKKADLLFVQHPGQVDSAISTGRAVYQVNNIVADEVFGIQHSGPREGIVIVGAFSGRKDIHLLLPVIREIADVRFVFIGGVEDREGARLFEVLSTYTNVTLCGALGHMQTVQRIAASRALLNTSRVEGFPNTFLEAWAVGTPVISYVFDPGGLIKKNRLGFVCDGNPEILKQLLREGAFEVDTDRIRRYVLDHHSMDAVARSFTTALTS